MATDRSPAARIPCALCDPAAVISVTSAPAPSPTLRLTAWLMLKSERGQTVCQHRLNQMRRENGLT